MGNKQNLWWMDDVIEHILNAYGVSYRQLMSTSRKESTSDARKLISYYLNLSTGLNYTLIGKIIKKSPSSIYTYMQVLKDLRDVDKKIASMMDYIEEKSVIPKSHKYKDVIVLLKASKKTNIKAFIKAINILKEAGN